MTRTSSRESTRASKTSRASRGQPFSCVVRGPGISVDVHLEEGDSIGDLLRSLGEGFGRGLHAARVGPSSEDPPVHRARHAAPDLDLEQRADAALARMIALLHDEEPDVRNLALGRLAELGESSDEAPPPAAVDPSLRLTVASDLREMWKAMWDSGPRAREGDSTRDAEWHAWIESAIGQRIIDESLGKFDVQLDARTSMTGRNN
jgi:hypothetical protein